MASGRTVRIGAAFLGGLALLATAGELPAQQGPAVDLVVGTEAPPLEQFAARELSAQLERVFQARVRIQQAVPEGSEHLVLLGSPATNPAIAAHWPAWPELSDQGHLLQTVTIRGRPALIVGGGSPVATLWAAYELGHSWGIRYLLYGDLDPVSAGPLTLEGYAKSWEPELRVRTWRTINDFAIGPESWGLQEQQRLLRQLAKLKFNRVLIAVYPWQPFVDFQFQGVAKRTGVLWYGYQYPVSGDTAGRAAFGGARVFENPDFAGKSTYEERVVAGRQLVTGIIDTAHNLGMTAGLLFSPLEFPAEFASVLPGAKTVRAPVPLSIGPGGQQSPQDATLRELVKTQIQAYLKAYPKLDQLYLSLPEFPEWSEHAEAAWQALDQRTGIGRKATLESLSEAAANRSLIASGDRGRQALRGNLVALEFLYRLLQDEKLLERERGARVQPVLVQIDPALFPWLPDLLPPGVETLHFLDYTARRVQRQVPVLESVPAEEIPSSLILTLADDNVGVLPQFAGDPLHGLVSHLRRLPWQGFSTRYWLVGDLDLSAVYLSRASFDESVTPESVCRDLLLPVCGEGVAERVLEGLSHAERATHLIDEQDLGFGFPVPNVVLKHYERGMMPPEWWSTVKDHYLNAMNEMYRANTRARQGGRSFTLYLARRFEFAFEYMNAIEAASKAGVAARQEDAETQLAELEKAVESMHAALAAMAAVARSNSDRGLIAVLNEYGYRPLKKELDQAYEQAGN